jgi:MFS family permease
MEDTPANLRTYWRLIQSNRNFRLLWTAQFVSEIGDWLYMVAIFSSLLELTGSARVVAFAFVMMVLPQCFVAPAAGVINDRLSRQKVMITTDWCRAVIVFSMMFVQTPGLLWALYCLLVLETVCWATFEPAHTAVIPNITSPEETLVANTLSSATWSFTLAAGSAIGGILAAYFGRTTVFVLNSLSFVISALLIRRMRFSEPHVQPARPMRIIDLFDFTPIAEGIRYVKQDGRLLATMFVKCGIGLMGANWVLLPLFGDRVFPLKVAGFDAKASGMLSMSLLMGCRGIGSLVGPIVAGLWTGTVHRRYLLAILIAFLLAAFGYGLLGAAPSLLIATVAIVIAHSGGSIAWVYSTTLLQAGTDDRFRGRVFSAEFAFSMAMLAVVSYAAGVFADSGVSVRTLAMWTGLATLIPSLLWAVAIRTLWAPEKCAVSHQSPRLEPGE